MIDLLAERHRIKVSKSKHRAMFGTGSLNGRDAALVKPLTFMNLSGQAVGPLMKQFALKPARVLVVADDLDLPTGKLRLREKGKSGGHNGHKSVMAALGTEEYPRIKIGIDCVAKHATIDHVLSAFDRDELPVIRKAIEDAADVCEAVVAGEWERGLRIVEMHNQALKMDGDEA